MKNKRKEMASSKCSDICANKREYTPMCTYCTKNRIIPKEDQKIVESFMKTMETKKNFACRVQLESYFDISVFGYELDKEANSRERGGVKRIHYKCSDAKPILKARKEASVDFRLPSKGSPILEIKDFGLEGLDSKGISCPDGRH